MSTEQFTPLTMTEVLEHCYQSIENLLENCPHENIKEAARNLCYDVVINHRFSGCYGKARRKGIKNRSRHQIHLSYTLLSYGDTSLRFDTVAHELAHILDSELRDAKSNHKGPWRRLHLWMGGNGQRLGPAVPESVPAPNRKVKIIYGDGTVEYITRRRWRYHKLDYTLMNMDKPGTIKKVCFLHSKNKREELRVG